MVNPWLTSNLRVAIEHRSCMQRSMATTLRSVTTAMPVDALFIVVLNGSWCWDASVGAINEPHCDDDYADSDGDGLADWEESLGAWGYISAPNMTDTDGDSVNDLDEILNGTDPNEPCNNLADFDGDGLNNWFENTNRMRDDVRYRWWQHEHR